MEKDLMTVHARVSGRVQGVCFRMETRRAARAFSVNGWVRNVPDGGVEAVFQGSPHNVQAMVEWCRKGPPLSRVMDVVVEPLTSTEKYLSFDIRY